MSKITFRADDDLVEELEAFDASKSEVMRDALRQYLDDRESSAVTADASAETAASGAEGSEDDERFDSLDDLVRDRVDAIVRERVDELVDERRSAVDRGPYRRPTSEPRQTREAQDVNVTVTLDGDAVGTTTADGDDEARKTIDDDAEDSSDARTCAQCGEVVDDDHVYCPNCGEKATRRVFCDCGDELRSDWGFCPSCGRRTPAADVLDSRKRD